MPSLAIPFVAVAILMRISDEELPSMARVVPKYMYLKLLNSSNLLNVIGFAVASATAILHSAYSLQSSYKVTVCVPEVLRNKCN